MPDEYPKEKLKELYELLPEDLKVALFSDKTADDIYDVCLENGLEEKNIEIAKYTGYVMLGLLPPNEFEKTLKEKLGLKDDTAKKVSQGITRLVFLPIKNSLEILHKTKVEIPPEPREELAEEMPEEETGEAPAGGAPEEQPARKKLGQDTYREPIE
jgi:hypothetical protein